MLLSEFINLEEKPGCNMTESGRACAVHGLNECPGYKMIEDSAREKLHKRHQELRKKSGLPDPEYYKELKASYDLPDQERLARVKEIKKKYNVNEAGPFSYGAKKPRRGSVADLAAKKRQEQERSRQPIEPKDQRVGVAKVVKELDVKGASAGDDAAYNQYAQTRAFGDRMDREASATPNPSSFALSTQAGWDNQDLQPKTQHYQSPLSKELIAAQTTGLAAQNPEMEKRYTMNKLATKPKMTSAEFAAQLESQGVAEGRGNIEALRTELMGEYLNIYYNALDGWNMTDHIINLQDVYGRVKRSRDPVLQQTYNLLMDHAEESIDVQASAALKAIRILGDEPNYTPPPRPPMSPEDSARADAFVNQFLAALVSHGIKTHPDWQKNNDKGVAEGVTSPEIKQAYDAIMKTAPKSPERKRAIKHYQQLRDDALDKKKEQGVAEGVEKYLEELSRAGYEVITETAELCPECGGPAFSDQLLAEKKDACYSKVKSRYKVWPSAYASGALVRCRKVGAKNWGNKSKK